MLIPPERSSAVLAKVSSKSCLSAVVDARLVDSRMGYNVFIVSSPTREHGMDINLHTNNKDKNILDKI